MSGEATTVSVRGTLLERGLLVAQGGQSVGGVGDGEPQEERMGRQPGSLREGPPVVLSGLRGYNSMTCLWKDPAGGSTGGETWEAAGWSGGRRQCQGGSMEAPD